MEALVAVMTEMELACREQLARYKQGDTTPVLEMMSLFAIHGFLQTGVRPSPETTLALTQKVPQARVWLRPQVPVAVH